jgi:PmbA protein
MIVEYDSIKDELLALVDTGLKKAKSVDKEADFEIFLYYENKSEVKIQQGAVFANAGSVVGTAVRAAKNQSIGFACSSGITPERIELAIQEAYAIADKISVKDERFKGFNENGKAAKEGLLADDIINLEIDQMIRDCQTIIDDASALDDQIIAVNAIALAFWSAHAVGNTRGVQVASRYGGNGCEAYITSQDGEVRHTGYAHDIARDRLYEHSEIGKKGAQDALQQHGATKLDVTAAMPTLWSPYSAGCFIQSSLGQSLLGQNIVQKISPLCDRIGDNIAFKGLTITDDGQDPRGWGTKAVDDEGYPQQTTPIIEKGVLKNYLFNTYNANALGLESTGNCGKGRSIMGNPAPFEATVSIYPTSFQVTPGTKDFDSLVSSIDGKAVLIFGYPIGIFHSSVATGDFSAMANNVQLIENGEIKGPLQSVSVAGSYYEGFKNIREIGSDVEATELAVVGPSILIDNLSVTG